VPNLSGPQVGKIRDAIVNSFTLATFTDFLYVRLDKRVDVIAGSVPFDQAALVVVQRASQEGWHLDLLNALRESRPHIADVFAIAVDKHIDVLPLDAHNLERAIKEKKPDADYNTVLTRIGSFRSKICNISYAVNGGVANGTGFLVGPSAIITNRHVMQRVINGSVEPAAVKLRFDYYRHDIGLSPNIGTIARLAADGWLIDDSPHDPLDTDADSDPDAARADDALDYALLQLANPIGNLPVGDGEEESEKRGWIYASPDAEVPAKHDVVFVFQHPEGEPLKWAQPDIVLGVNSNQNRVRYSVNTDNGSSGSPVFDAAFQLIALHHAGDPNFEPLHRPEYNQGIPISRIVSQLSQRGHDAWLGDDSEGGAQ
jgi:hypothetical protein